MNFSCKGNECRTSNRSCQTEEVVCSNGVFVLSKCRPGSIETAKQVERLKLFASQMEESE
jgi:hypothetical protein